MHYSVLLKEGGTAVTEGGCFSIIMSEREQKEKERGAGTVTG